MEAIPVWMIISPPASVIPTKLSMTLGYCVIDPAGRQQRTKYSSGLQEEPPDNPAVQFPSIDASFLIGFFAVNISRYKP